MIKKVLIALMVVLMMVTVSSARVIEDVELPETLTFGDQVLLLNGGGTRNVFLNDVYVGGLYLESENTDGDAIASADEPMAVRIHIVNDFFASSERFSDAIKKGFRFAMPRGDISPVQEEYDRFKAAFSDENVDHQEIDLVYIPGKGTSCIKDGELRDTVPGLEFKRILYGIFISEKATVNSELTEGMLEGKFSPEALAAKQQWIAKIDVEKNAVMAQAKAAEEAAIKAADEAKTAAAVEAKAAEDAAMKAAEEVKVAAVDKTKAAEAAAMKAKSAANAQAAKKAAAVAAAATKTASKTADMVVTKDNFSDADVFFGVNSTSLNADAKKALTQKAKWLKSNPIASVAVEVYCDSRGSKAYNMKLAKKRAKSVVNYMVDAGIDSSRLELVIKGAVDSAANENAWANNRRAHFKIK
jgi:outer membrane protein OmpA-like peptidoglycan-associated protein